MRYCIFINCHNVIDNREKELEIEKGATFEYFLELYNKDNTLMDLSSYSALMQIRQNKDEDPEISLPLLELSVENGRIALSSTGLISLHIDADTTKDIEWSHAYYDLFILMRDQGQIYRRKLIYGSVSVIPSITIWP